MSAEVFEWNGRGSVQIVAEHAHVHRDGVCVKNWFGVKCSAPTGSVHQATAKRTDQAAYAADLLEKQSLWPADRDGNDPESDRVIQEALVRATLAIVEQQRIANLTEYLKISEARHAMDERHVALDAEVREALGLS